MLGQTGQPTAGVEPHLLCEDDRRRIDEGYRNLHPKCHNTIWLQCQACNRFLPKRLAEGLRGCVKSGHVKNVVRMILSAHV